MRVAVRVLGPAVLVERAVCEESVPDDRTTTLAGDQRGAIEGTGQLHDPPAERAQCTGERSHLMVGHEIGHHRRAVVVELHISDLARNLRAPPAPALLHGLYEESAHFLEFQVSDAVSLRLVHTGDVRVQRGQRNEGHHVHALRRPVDAAEELREGHPVPRHSGPHRLEGYRLVTRDGEHRSIAVLRPAGCEPETAVADHDARDAVPARHRAPRVPEDLAVVVGVEIDKARGDDPSRTRRPPLRPRTHRRCRSRRPFHRRCPHPPCNAASAARR